MANAIIKKAYEKLLTLGIDALDNRYVAVDPNFTSLFMNSRHEFDDQKFILGQVTSALEVSLPLERAILSTYADAGVQNWYERGLDFSWTYHKERGMRISVLVSRT